MMKKGFVLGLLFMVLVGCLGSSMASADGGNRLTVKVDGFRSTNGVVWVTLFKSADGFPVPTEGNSAGFVSVQVAPDMTATAVFEDLPSGEYAVSVLHDENANQQMDMNDSGMPMEGFGFSNNSGMSYEQCSFNLKNDNQSIEIHMMYIQ